MHFIDTSSGTAQNFYFNITRYYDALAKPASTEFFPLPKYRNEGLPIVPITAETIDNMLTNDFDEFKSVTPQLSRTTLESLPDGYVAEMCANMFTGEPLSDETWIPIRNANQLLVNVYTLPAALIVSGVLRCRLKRVSNPDEKANIQLLNYQLVYAIAKFLQEVVISTPPKHLIAAETRRVIEDGVFENTVWLDANLLEVYLGRGIDVAKIVGHWILNRTSPTMADLVDNEDLDIFVETYLRKVD